MLLEAESVHELSIALSLIDAACEELPRLGAVRVDALHLRLGALSGVVREALLFSFDLAAKGTAIEGARLEIETIAATVFCGQCQAERAIESFPCLCCPVCGAPVERVVRGRELELTALEVTDHEPSDRRGAQERPEEE